MKEYSKIQTLFKRDLSNKGQIIEGSWSLPEFEFLKSNQWTFTEKVDGTNIRLKWRKSQDGSMGLSVGGKSDNAQIPANLLDAIAAMQLAPKLAEGFPDEICLYGEGYGPGIQKGGGRYRQSKSFVLFDVLCGDLWLQRDDVNDVAAKLGLDAVPVLGKGALQDAIEFTRNGFNSKWGEFPAEGIVLRPSTELRTRRGDRMIAKIKHVDFTGGKFS